MLHSAPLHHKVHQRRLLSGAENGRKLLGARSKTGNQWMNECILRWRTWGFHRRGRCAPKVRASREEGARILIVTETALQEMNFPMQQGELCNPCIIPPRKSRMQFLHAYVSALQRCEAQKMSQRNKRLWVLVPTNDRQHVHELVSATEFGDNIAQWRQTHSRYFKISDTSISLRVEKTQREVGIWVCPKPLLHPFRMLVLPDSKNHYR